MRRQHTGRKRETLFGFSCRLGITFVSCMPIRISQRRIRCSLGRVVGSRGITARLALFCGFAVAFTLHSIPLCALGMNGRRWRTQSMPRKEEIPRLDVMVHKAALMDTFQCSQTGNTQPKSIVQHSGVQKHVVFVLRTTLAFLRNLWRFCATCSCSPREFELSKAVMAVCPGVHHNPRPQFLQVHPTPPHH